MQTLHWPICTLRALQQRPPTRQRLRPQLLPQAPPPRLTMAPSIVVETPTTTTNRHRFQSNLWPLVLVVANPLHLVLPLWRRQLHIVLPLQLEQQQRFIMQQIPSIRCTPPIRRRPIITIIMVASTWPLVVANIIVVITATST